MPGEIENGHESLQSAISAQARRLAVEPHNLLSADAIEAIAVEPPETLGDLRRLVSDRSAHSPMLGPVLMEIISSVFLSEPREAETVDPLDTPLDLSPQVENTGPRRRRPKISRPKVTLKLRYGKLKIFCGICRETKGNFQSRKTAQNWMRYIHDCGDDTYRKIRIKRFCFKCVCGERSERYKRKNAFLRRIQEHRRSCDQRQEVWINLNIEGFTGYQNALVQHKDS